MRSLWKKQVPAFLLALVMALSLMPVAQARSNNTVHYATEAGDGVKFRSSDFANLFDRTCTLAYVKLESPSGLDRAGRLYSEQHVENADGTFKTYDVELRERDFADSPFFVENRSDFDDGDYYLNRTEFVADRKADDQTVTFAFEATARDRDNNRVKESGTVEIKIGKGGGSSTSASSIRYDVIPGKALDIDVMDFENLYSKNCAGNLLYAEFTDTRDLSAGDGSFVYMYDTNQAKEFTASTLGRYKFFFSDKNYGDYGMIKMSFVPSRSFSDTVELGFRLYGDRSNTVDGTLVLRSTNDKGGSTVKADIYLKTAADGTVRLDARDFRTLFQGKFPTGTLDFMTFTDMGNLRSCGEFTAKNKGGSTVSLDERNLNNVWFHDRFIPRSSDCDLNSLVFTADRTHDDVLEMAFQLYGEDSTQKMDGVLAITLGEKTAETKADITYSVAPGQAVAFSMNDFDRFYNGGRTDPLRYVEFFDAKGLSPYNGSIIAQYGTRYEEIFTPSSLESYRFFTTNKADGQYALSDLSFVADRRFSDSVTISFRAYGERTYRDGVLSITTGAGNPLSGMTFGTGFDVRYATTGTSAVKINANDIARFYTKTFPGKTLQTVKLMGLPTEGTLVYNNSGRSQFGTPYQMLLLGNMWQNLTFTYNPTSTASYNLDELTYVPALANRCTSIPFTAVGTGGSVTGAIYIGVTSKALPEVYGVFRKGAPVAFPAAAVYKEVQNATGSALSGIRFLEIPSAAKGTLTVNGLAMPADTIYNYSSGSPRMSQVTFTPAPGFTGNVALPYTAYDSTGSTVAYGVVSFGIVSQQKTFKDMKPNTWCYKYVTELSDAGIVGGYQDGTFKEKNELTWRAAMKLICLANGLGKSTDNIDAFFSLAQSRGWVPATAKATSPITRQEFCQVAAKAMNLSTVNNPSVSPFSDTSDPAVLALNAAGIIGGYKDGTFLPNKILTRGHISAIIWRMNQYK